MRIIPGCLQIIRKVSSQSSLGRRIMPVQWTSLGFEPCKPHVLWRIGQLYTYSLSLPLFSDGRLSLDQVLKGESQADVHRYDSHGNVTLGKVRPVDGQWCFVWPRQRQRIDPVVRLHGRRFLPGDTVCLRSSNSIAALYWVCRETP